METEKKKIGTIYEGDKFRKALKQVIQKISYRSKKDVHDVRTCVRFDVKDNVLALCYTDSFRLTYQEFNKISFDKDVSFNVSINIAKILLAIKDNEIEVWESEGGYIFETKKPTLVGSKGDYYVPYKTALKSYDRSGSFDINVSTIHLIEVLKEALRVAKLNKEAKNGVILSISKEEMKIFTKNETDVYKMNIPIINESGTELEIAININHLLDFFKLKLDKITQINFLDRRSAIFIKTNNNLKHIFMPLAWTGE